MINGAGMTAARRPQVASQVSPGSLQSAEHSEDLFRHLKVEDLESGIREERRCEKLGALDAHAVRPEAKPLRAGERRGGDGRWSELLEVRERSGRARGRMAGEGAARAVRVRFAAIPEERARVPSAPMPLPRSSSCRRQRLRHRAAPNAVAPLSPRVLS